MPLIGVHIEQDSSIMVAFDDVPEDGLNSPLRLEKLANEVCYSEFSVASRFFILAASVTLCRQIVFFLF